MGVCVHVLGTSIGTVSCGSTVDARLSFVCISKYSLAVGATEPASVAAAAWCLSWPTSCR